MNTDYQKLCPLAKTSISGEVWDEDMTDAAVEVFASEAKNRPQRRAKKAAREKRKAEEAAAQKEGETAEAETAPQSAAAPSADGTPRDYSRLTRFLPVLETDETLYDEENGYSDVVFRFMEELELACEREPEHEGLREMKRIFDQEEHSPGYIFQHLPELLRELRALEAGRS
jgi:hypothetical protein